ncbi:ankyrin repeat-containing domain protein [Ilyonectria destructans]|nr:ankyrin repeat-containing domain protein [Ilyonectria destructans]
MLIANFQSLTAQVVIGVDHQGRAKSRLDREKEVEAELFDGCARYYLTAALSLVASPVDGTCEWILEDPSYQNWLRNERGKSQSLWIRGKPGMGKSVLAKYIFQHLIESQATTKAELPVESKPLCCFFSFSRDRLGHELAQGFLSQLVRSQPDLVQYLERDFHLCKDSGGLFSSTNRDALWATFEAALSNATTDKVFLIIDALDECESSSIQWVCERLVRLGSSSIGPTRKIIFTSRLSASLNESMFEGSSIIDLDSLAAQGALDHDINRTVFSCILGQFHGHRDDQNISNEIVKALTEKSNGCILWSILATEVLLRLRAEGPKLMRKAVSELPVGLDGLYYILLFSNVDPRYRTRVAPVLAWAMYASRPLTVSELSCVIRQDDVDLKRLGNRMKHLTEPIGSLINLNEGSHILRFLHHPTAKEFLESVDHINPDLAGFMEDKAAHRMIAKTTYLSLLETSFSQSPTPSVESSSTIASTVSPLHNYASRHWIEHARQASADVADIFDPEDAFCILDSKIRYRWLKTHHATELRGLEKPEDFDMTYLAAFFGLTPVLSKWLDLDKQGRGQYPHKPSSDWMMHPIHWASRNGHYECVKLLLDHGVDIYARGRGMTPIAWAVRNGHAKIVQLFISYGCSVNIVDKGLTLLGWAAWDGRHEVATILIHEGANLNPKSDLCLSQYLTTEWTNAPNFLRRVISGDRELLLITEYTMMEISNCRTALYCASAAFTASLCSYFVTGDIWKASNTLHQSGNTMLSRDYWDISSSTMSGLLVLVANCLRGNGQQALDLFSSELFNTYCGLLYMALTNTVCLLVSRAMLRTDRAILVATSIVAGQIITSTIMPSLSTARVLSSALNFNILNILWACNRTRSWQAGATILTVSLCVIIGASSQFDLAVLSAALALASLLSSIKQKLVAGLTPLNLAASRGHAEVVKLLLDCGARPSQTIKDTNSAIYLAVKYVHHPTINVLLQYYSSHENRLDDAPSTLQLAVLCSRMDIVHQLIERGADVNELSPRGFCALRTSSFAGNYEMTTYLLSNGADINVSSRDGVSPLLAAVCGGHQSVVLALLKHQADAQKATVDGVTPLHIACWVTNRQIMKLLLDAGACLTSKDRQGLTPSDYAAEIIGLNYWPTEPKSST